MTPAAPHLPSIAYVGIAALVAWRIFKRTRRLVGRQTLSRVRPWITVTLVPLGVVALFALSLRHPLNAAVLLAALAAGTALGVYGLRLTRFEVTPAGWFYTPNAHIGIALTLVLVSRLGYRAFQWYHLGTDAASGADFTRSPWTLLPLGAIAGYYVTYAVGLLRWRHAGATAPVTPPAT